MKKNLVVIFDFDGTIVEIMSSIRDILNQLSDEFGFRKVGEDDIKKLRGKKTQEVFKSLGISSRKIPLIAERIRSDLFREIENIKPIKGIKKVLSQLKKNGYELGMLTSNLRENVEKFLKKNNLDLFDFIYSESSIFGKDEVMGILLKERNLNPEDVLYVGDETRDIEAAKKAGVKVIAVSWGFNTEKVLRKQKPDHLIKNPEELNEFLNRF